MRSFSKKYADIDISFLKAIGSSIFTSFTKYAKDHPIRRHSVEAVKSAVEEFHKDWDNKEHMKSFRAVFLKKVSDNFAMIALRENIPLG